MPYTNLRCYNLLTWSRDTIGLFLLEPFAEQDVPVHLMKRTCGFSLGLQRNTPTFCRYGVAIDVFSVPWLSIVGDEQFFGNVNCVTDWSEKN